MAGKFQNNDQPKASTVSSVWNVIKNVFTWLLVIAAVAMMIFTVVSVNTFDRNDRSLFGYKAYVVRSDSMKATDFAAGDLVLVKEVDPVTLQVGDIISFQSTNAESYGEMVTHKIRRIVSDSYGNPAFITYGTTTNVDDSSVVEYGYVRGKYQFAIPYVGTFFEFLKTTPGYIVCIFLPFLALIGIQGFQSVKLFKQYKDEQMAQLEQERQQERQAIEEERKKLEAQQEESRRMMEQLLALQQQLQGNPAAAAAVELPQEPQSESREEPAPQPQPQPQEEPREKTDEELLNDILNEFSSDSQA